MNTLLTILLVFLGIIALFLIIALITRKHYNIEREVIINAPLDKVFQYIIHLKNQDHFNKWVMVEPEMQRNFKGTDGTVGFIYGWNGKKAGEGEQEITSITNGESIATEIRFVRPFVGLANVKMTTQELSENQTKVTWSNVSKMKYPLNALLPMVEKMLAKDMDTSLGNLKTILEK